MSCACLEESQPPQVLNGEGGLESCSLAVYTCAGAYPEEGRL